MDLQTRLAALSKLVSSTSETVDRRLDEEFSRVLRTLEDSSDFDELSDALKTLAVLSRRFHLAMMQPLEDFVHSIGNRTLTQGGSPIHTSMRRYLSPDTLIALAIDAARDIQYLHTEWVVKILLALSHADSTDVSKKAERTLDDLAEFDLDVFYEHQQGATPQTRVLNYLSGLKDEELHANSGAALRVLAQLLSPSIEGRSWSYSGVTITRGTIVSDGGVAEMREGAIALLKRMYFLDASVDYRKRVLQTMNAGTRRERVADNSDTAKMFDRDAVSILDFMRSLVETESLPLVQSIEHQAYWDFYHAPSEEIEHKALEVRDAIAANEEYQIYKQLIGYEGIFGPWEDLRRSEDAWDYGDSKRRIAAREFVEQIDLNYGTWLARILEFSKTRSNDLATFPVYYEFLETVGREKPTLALELATDHEELMSPFLIPLLRGLWESEASEQVERLVALWIANGSNLASIARSLYRVGGSRLEVLDAVITRSVELEDRHPILDTIGVSASLYSEGVDAAKLVFMRALRELAKRNDPRWVNSVWMSRDVEALIASLTPDERAEVLSSLESLPEIDYRAEEVLFAIGQQDVFAVLDFFVRRIRSAETRSNSSDALSSEYEAVPYQFQRLDKLFESIPNELLAALRLDFNEDTRGLFSFRGARLVEAAFPEFGSPIDSILLEIARSGTDEDIDFVIGVLRTYDGSTAILEVCKAIIRALPAHSKKWSEVAAAIETTGVVTGEYGLAQAYENKLDLIKDWREDESDRVRSFAEWLSEDLKRIAERERIRADESIAMRKYKYGASDEGD